MEIKSTLGQMQTMQFGEQFSRNYGDGLTFKSKPVIISDNYFSSGYMYVEVGKRGFGAEFTCPTQRLAPKRHTSKISPLFKRKCKH
eukprot:5849852-Ditylum_brightwellii.AAC.1